MQSIFLQLGGNEDQLLMDQNFAHDTLKLIDILDPQRHQKTNCKSQDKGSQFNNSYVRSAPNNILPT
jgi:hypothetical protein